MSETPWSTTIEWPEWPPLWPRLWRLSRRWPKDPLRVKQRSLLRTLAASAEGPYEAAPLVASLGEDHRGRYRSILRRLSGRLASGMPLADALEQTPGALPDDIVLAVRFGSQSGLLAESLNAELKIRHDAWERIDRKLGRMIAYLTGTLLLGTFIVCFLFIYIFPTFFEISHDFYLSSPPALTWLLEIGNFFFQFAALLVPGFFLLLWVFWARWPKRYLRRTFSTRWFRSVLERRAARLLHYLALAAKGGRPLAGALSTLARYHYDGPFRRKLLYVRNEVEQEADLWESLVRTRILSPAESKAIVTAPDGNSRIWTLQRLAQGKETRITERIDWWLDLIEPAAILLLASGVLLLAVSIFSWLYSLVGGLA